MEEWKEYKLGEVATLTTGFPFDGHKYVKEGIRVVRGDNVTIGNLRWDTDKDKRWNETFYRASEFSLYAGDIVIGMDGSRVGKNRAQIKQEDLPLYIAQRVACVRHNELSLQSFLYYLIFSRDFENYIKSVQTGTSIPHISLKQIGEFPVLLPSILSQQRIASILKSLDDKIECNKRINDNLPWSLWMVHLILFLLKRKNDNLEQQAQALFKSWFVDFEPFKDGEFVESELGLIPKGWRVGKLHEIADITMGVSPSGKSYNTNGQGDVFYQGRAEFSFRFPKRNLFTTEAKRFADVDTVLVSVRAPVGDINVAEERCCIGRGLASVKAKNKCNSFILYLLQSLRPVFDKYNGEGTVFGSINKKTFEEIPIIIPEEYVIQDFESVAHSFDCQIKNKEVESRRLAQLRDTLLPRLMSGELKVNEIEKV